MGEYQELYSSTKRKIDS